MRGHNDKLRCFGRSQVFGGCRCEALAPANQTARLGQCPRGGSCDQIFPYFLALSVLSSFIISLGGTPGFMLLVRSDLCNRKPPACRGIVKAVHYRKLSWGKQQIFEIGAVSETDKPPSGCPGRALHNFGCLPCTFL